MTGRPVVRVRLKSADSPQVTSNRGHGRSPELSVYKPRIIERTEGTGRIHRPTALVPGRPDARGPTPERDHRLPGEPGVRLQPPAGSAVAPSVVVPSGPATTVAPSAPTVRRLPSETGERRPDFPLGDKGNELRQRQPAVPYGEADPGRIGFSVGDRRL